MSDQFYKTLKFRRITLEQFGSGSYPHQPRYADSRTYVAPLLGWLGRDGKAPRVYDVGGYIGRFSIETALLQRGSERPVSIECFEPGDTFDMLCRNLELNGLSSFVVVHQEAVADQVGKVLFAVPPDAMITSRIVEGPDEAQARGWSHREVAVTTLGSKMVAANLAPDTPFLAKIDTEGREHLVISGIPLDAIQQAAHALVVEFWPKLRQETIHGVPAEQFLFEHYRLFELRNSLYPAGCVELVDLEDLSARVERKELSTPDLLCLSRNIPNLPDLIKELQAAVP